MYLEMTIQLNHCSLFNSDIASVHENLGFDKIIEIDPLNEEDKMSIEQKEYFIDMFNKDDEHRRKVYYTSISRKKLLEAEYKRISEEEKNFSE